MSWLRSRRQTPRPRLGRLPRTKPADSCPEGRTVPLAWRGTNGDRDRSVTPSTRPHVYTRGPSSAEFRNHPVRPQRRAEGQLPRALPGNQRIQRQHLLIRQRRRPTGREFARLRCRAAFAILACHQKIAERPTPRISAPAVIPTANGGKTTSASPENRMHFGQARSGSAPPYRRRLPSPPHQAASSSRSSPPRSARWPRHPRPRRRRLGHSLAPAGSDLIWMRVHEGDRVRSVIGGEVFGYAWRWLWRWWSFRPKVAGVWW